MQDTSVLLIQRRDHTTIRQGHQQCLSSNRSKNNSRPWMRRTPTSESSISVNDTTSSELPPGSSPAPSSFCSVSLEGSISGFCLPTQSATIGDNRMQERRMIRQGLNTYICGIFAQDPGSGYTRRATSSFVLPSAPVMQCSELKTTMFPPLAHPHQMLCPMPSLWTGSPASFSRNRPASIYRRTRPSILLK